jgi:hypothetical protein
MSPFALLPSSWGDASMPPRTVPRPSGAQGLLLCDTAAYRSRCSRRPLANFLILAETIPEVRPRIGVNIVQGSTISKLTGFPWYAAASMRSGTLGASGNASCHVARASAKDIGFNCGLVGVQPDGSKLASAKRTAQSGFGDAWVSTRSATARNRRSRPIPSRPISTSPGADNGGSPGSTPLIGLMPTKGRGLWR